MILIADSGSTKTDWCVVLNGAVIKRLGTKGINPFFQSEEEIQQKLTASLLPQLPEGKFNAVYFYGAGCTPEKAPVLRRAIADSLPVIGNIKANSDMLAAAHGLCGQKAGIACILGTGSNSCFYNGKEIVSNISPLGFILGDEGSGRRYSEKSTSCHLERRVSEAVRSDASRNHRPGLSPALSQSFFGQSLSFYRTAFGRTGYPPISYEQLYSFLSQECDAV